MKIREQDNPRTVRILCVGKFQKRKNHCLLIRALMHLRHDYQATLTIVGEMSDDQPEHQYVNNKIRQLLRELQAENVVAIKTNLPHRQVLAEYLVHDLFVLPSGREPASFSQLEAMAAGLPVICSDDNGTACYVEEDRNGFIFTAGNQDDLTAKLKKTIKSAEKLQQLGERSSVLAQTVHSPDKYRQTILKACGYDIPESMGHNYESSVR